MAKVNNKDVLQSYIMTTAKYDFSVYEKRILYRIIETLQGNIDGLKLNAKHSIRIDLFGDAVLVMPISSFLKDEEDKNYTQVKKAFTDLENKKITYEDEKTWQIMRIVQAPKLDKYNSFIEFRLDKKIYEAFLNFSKGYRKYELTTAMQFESVYTMRFYELLSGQKKPLTYSIDTLKEMFGITEKYERISQFKAKVLDVAKKELDKCSPYTFDYQMNKTGRAFTSVTFYPIYQPQFRDSDLEKRELQKQLSPSWKLPENVLNYLKSNFDFDTKEIKQNIDLFDLVNSKIDFIQFMANVKARANRAKNPKGYLINALKKELNK